MQAKTLIHSHVSFAHSRMRRLIQWESIQIIGSRSNWAFQLLNILIDVYRGQLTELSTVEGLPANFSNWFQIQNESAGHNVISITHLYVTTVNVMTINPSDIDDTQTHDHRPVFISLYVSVVGGLRFFRLSFFLLLSLSLFYFSLSFLFHSFLILFPSFHSFS